MFNSVEGFAVHVYMATPFLGFMGFASLAYAELKVNFVEGFAVLWLTPFEYFRFHVSKFQVVQQFNGLKPFDVYRFMTI